MVNGPEIIPPFYPSSLVLAGGGQLQLYQQALKQGQENLR